MAPKGREIKITLSGEDAGGIALLKKLADQSAATDARTKPAMESISKALAKAEKAATDAGTKGAQGVKSFGDAIQNLSSKSVGDLASKLPGGGILDAFGGSDALLAGVGTKAAVAAGAVAAVGTAAVVAGQKSIAAFTDMAGQVQKFSFLTGQSAEEASGWVGALNASGIGVDQWVDRVRQFQTNMAQSEERFSNLGVEIQRFSDGTTDATSTMMNAIQMLHDTPDIIERQRIGFQLFGESWTQLEAIIRDPAAFNEMRDNYEGAFSEKDLDKLTAFNRSMGQFTTTVKIAAAGIGSELVPVMTALAGDLEAVISAITDGKNKLEEWKEVADEKSDGWLSKAAMAALRAGLSTASGGATEVAFAAHDAANAVKDLSNEQQQAGPAAAKWGAEQAAAADKVIDAYGGALEKMNNARFSAADASANVADVEKANARSIASAEKQAADSIASAAAQVESARESRAQAGADLAKAEVEASKQIADAERSAAKSIASAEKQVTEAREDQAEAIVEQAKTAKDVDKDLAEASEQAADMIVKAQERVSDARDKATKNARDNADRLTDAENDYNDALLAALDEDNPYKAARQRDDAAVKLQRTQRDVVESDAEAKKDVDEAEAELTKAVEEANELRAEAAEDAAERTEKAQERVIEAGEQVLEAEQALVEARQEANRQIAEAYEGAAQRIEQAQSRVKEADRQVESAHTTQNATMITAEGNLALAHEQAADRIADAREKEIIANLALAASIRAVDLARDKLPEIPASQAPGGVDWARQMAGWTAWNNTGATRAPGRAVGGQVSAGQVYQVHDGEYFQPNQSGQVKQAGGGPTFILQAGTLVHESGLPELMRKLKRMGETW